MPSEKPPRRSQKASVPPTIDLEAERVDNASNETPSASEAKADTVDATVKAEKTPEAATKDAPAKDTKTESATASQSTSSEPKKDAAPKESAKKPNNKEPAKPAVPAKKSGGGSAGAIAAGIFGGLVALAGAGAAQYGGYIPNFGPAEKVDLSAVTSQISALQTKLDAVAQKADNPPQTDLGPINAKIQSIETAMSKLPVGDLTDVLAIQGKLNETAAKTAKFQEELASVANRLKEAEARINQPRDDIDVARAIASAGLKAAIDRGGPFQAELSTLKSVAPDDPAVAQLQTFAEKGVPSRAELIKSYPDAADNMMAVLNKPIPGQSLSERLFKSAFSVIKVRPVGDVKGNSPQAIIARIGAKLQNGDLAGAAKEWDALPDDLKAAGADFRSELDARIQVEALVSETLKNAVTDQKKQG